MIETVLGMTDLQMKLVTAIGQLAMAAGVAYVAYRQWRTAEQQAVIAQKRLKADLFDRRLAAVDELESIIADLRRRWPSPSYSLTLLRHGNKFGYLFGNRAAAAVAKLASIAMLASENAERQRESAELPVDPNRSLRKRQLANLRIDFDRQADAVRLLVAADLALSH